MLAKKCAAWLCLWWDATSSSATSKYASSQTENGSFAIIWVHVRIKHPLTNRSPKKLHVVDMWGFNSWRLLESCALYKSSSQQHGTCLDFLISTVKNLDEHEVSFASVLFLNNKLNVTTQEWFHISLIYQLKYEPPSQYSHHWQYILPESPNFIFIM